MKKRGMKKKGLIRLAYPVLVFLLALIFLIFFKYVHESESIAGMTGMITAEGGHVTELDFSVPSSSAKWAAVYGEIEAGGTENNVSAEIQTDTVNELNLAFNCGGSELYAADFVVTNWSSVAAGGPELIDNFLGINNAHPESASKMFTQTVVFLVKDMSITAPAAYTAVLGSGSQTFDLGILKAGPLQNIVIVTHIVSDKVGFDGDTHDFQMLLPVKDTNMTYYFFTDCTAPPAVPEEKKTISNGGKYYPNLSLPPKKELPEISSMIIKPTGPEAYQAEKGKSGEETGEAGLPQPPLSKKQFMLQIEKPSPLLILAFFLLAIILLIILLIIVSRLIQKKHNKPYNKKHKKKSKCSRPLPVTDR